MNDELEALFKGATFDSQTTLFKGAAFSGGEAASLDWVKFGLGSISFEAPKQWDPAPKFAWEGEGATAAKPANVKPDAWPPSRKS